MGCGVDEAGRGPVIGPMIIAGVCASRKKLMEIGVKDSKKLSPSRREKLAEEIRKMADKIVIRRVEPEEIDEYRDSMTINQMETMMFASVIKELRCKRVYVDAADVDELRFAEDILSHLNKEVEIISRHKADDIYPEVSAASIIAKVERDRIIEKISEEIGYFGSGYPSDSRTREFIKEYYKKHGKLPPHIRKSWDTVKKLISETKQTKLDGY